MTHFTLARREKIDGGVLCGCSSFYAMTLSEYLWSRFLSVGPIVCDSLFLCVDFCIGIAIIPYSQRYRKDVDQHVFCDAN